MGGVWQDLKFALRMMRRRPGYTGVAALTLALTIGATTTIFSVVDGVLLRPLPYPEPDRLVTIWETADSFPEMSVNYLDLLDWQKQQTAFSGLGAYRGDSFNVSTPGGRPEHLDGAMYSASLLPTLGVAPVLGRNFTEVEDRLNGPPAALLAHAAWRQRFGGDPGVVGKTITLDGVAHTVVGVLPASFHLDKAQVVVPLGRLDERARRRGNHPGIIGAGRLAPGVTVHEARVDLEKIGAALGKTYHENEGVLPAVAPMHARLVKDVRTTLWILLGAVGFVLLIGVANVANLTLARATVRRRERAIRAALGASRLRLVRQLLIESSLVALVGGTLGVLLAMWGVDVLAAVRPEQALPLQTAVHLDARVLAFTTAISLAAGVLFGLVPALGASRTVVSAGVVPSHDRSRSALVIAEVALALVLLVGAGLSTNAFLRLSRSDLGFQPDRVLATVMPVPLGRHPTKQDGLVFLRQVSDRVAALPGVAAAAISIGLPLAGSSESGFSVEGRPSHDARDAVMAVYYATDERYLETMRIPLLEGRYLARTDGMDAPKVAVIDDVMAREIFPGGALGKHFLDRDGKPDTEIVGVVHHVVNYGLGEKEPARYQVYIPLTQASEHFFALMLQETVIVVRSDGTPPESLRAPLAAAVESVDPDQPIYGTKTMGQLVRESLGPRRFAMLLLGAFAGLALALAWIGLYAVMSYTVAQRTREIGVRMALGARARDVRRLVLRQGLRLVAIGIALGVGGALALTRVMQSLLAGLPATDPATFALTAAALAVAATAATLVPARRATRVDPMIAIRSE